MSIKLTDFFINVIDFFSVLLPGVLVVYTIKGIALNPLFGSEGMFLVLKTGLKGWLLFILATYILGHIIFLLGSLLIDMYVYHKISRNTFFRSLVIALLFISVVLVSEASWYVILFFVLTLLNAYRYEYLRYKFIQMANELTIIKFPDNKQEETVVAHGTNENKAINKFFAFPGEIIKVPYNTSLEISD